MATDTYGVIAPPKDPSDVADWSFQFAGAGLGAAEAITGTPTVTVDPIAGDASPLAVGAISTSGSPAQTVNVFLSAGTAGNDYRLHITIVTNQGRTFNRDAIVPVRQL